MRMEGTPASPRSDPSMQEIELKQIVRWKRDEISGKNRMEVNEALLEEVIGDCDNWFISLVVVGSSSRRNTKLFGKLIECFNTRKTALQKYRFDENKYTVHRKGVWIGSKPLMVNLKDGTTFPVFLLEVQSTRDECTEDFEIHNIFELGLLMSSVLILNFTERIDENILRWFGDSHDFAQSVVCFPRGRSYTGFAHRRKRWDLNGFFSSLRSKFQSVVFLIGDNGLSMNKKFRSGPEQPKSKMKKLRPFLYGDEKFVTKSSKCSRDFIFNCFDNVICSFSSVNLNEITIPDVSFIFVDKDIWSQIKLLCGVPLQVKLYKKLFISTVSLMNEDFFDVSEYVAIRSAMFQTCASNFTEFIGKLVKREVVKFSSERNIFHDGVFRRKHAMLLQVTKHYIRDYSVDLDKHMRSFWCSSEIRSNKFKPDVCVKNLEVIMTEISTSFDAILNTHVMDFCHQKNMFMREIIDDSKKYANLEVGKCIAQWDNTRFKTGEEIDQIISNLQSDILKRTKSKHPRVTFETSEIMYFVAEKKSELILHNEGVFKRISEDFQRSFMKIIGSLVDKLIEAINNLSCNSFEEFQSLCARQKQIHEEHFKLNEVEKFCSIVVASELPKTEPLFSQVLTTMTRIYVDRCVNNTFVKRNDVYSKLAIVIPSQDNTVSISFGTADVKHEVFPRVQIHIWEIMNDSTINTRIILELVELGLFDALEMERPLHGKFDLEQDRVLSLMRVIQNRNSDEIQICLEKLCNLRSSHLKRNQFRDAFGIVFQDCIKADVANTNL